MRRHTKNKGRVQAANVRKYQNSQRDHSTTVEQPLQSLSSAIWQLSYSLEESRQHHQAAGNRIRQAACIFGQVTLRLIGGGV